MQLTATTSQQANPFLEVVRPLMGDLLVSTLATKPRNSRERNRKGGIASFVLEICSHMQGQLATFRDRQPEDSLEGQRSATPRIGAQRLVCNWRVSTALVHR